MDAQAVIASKNNRSLLLLTMGVLAPTIGSLTLISLLPDWQLVEPIPHATIESLGAVVALVVLMLLQTTHTSPSISNSEINIACAGLAAMAILDIFHAVVEPGNLFVWYHSIATFVGGGLFACVYLQKYYSQASSSLMTFAIGFSLFLGVFFMVTPATAPSVIAGRSFTSLGSFLNIVGGLGFFASAWYMWQRYLATGKTDYYLLSAHCLLFGSAGILVELSTLWDAAWWWWHLLRFIAYTLLVVFFFRTVFHRLEEDVSEFVSMTERAGRKSEKHALFHTLALICGLAVSAIALMVLAGWFLKIRLLVQVVPTFAPMQFNTALCFILTAGGLISLVFNRSQHAVWFGSVVLAISGLTMIEYITGLPTGLDEAFVDPFVQTRTEIAGRMSIPTMIGFLMCGGLLASSDYTLKKGHYLAFELAGLAVFAPTALVLIAYAEQAGENNFLTILTGMAVHTTTCFGLLGLGFASTAWHRQKEQITTVPLWIPATFCLGAFILDLLTPLGVAAGIVYTPLIFCSLWFQKKYYVFVFALTASLLTILGYFTSFDAGVNNTTVLANRSLAVGLIWLLAAILYLQRLTQEKYDHNRLRLKNMFTHMTDAVVTFNKDGVIDSYNKAAQELFGIHPTAAKGQNIRQFVLDFQNTEAFEDTYNMFQIRHEAMGIKQGHGTVPISVSISDIPTQKGTIFSAIIRDISVRKANEERIQKTLYELEQSNKALDDFAYIASHDLREPLRGLYNHARFLLEDYEDKLSEDGIMRLNRMIALAGKQENLIKNLLYFSRLGRSDEAYQDTDLGDLITDVKERLHEFLEENNAEVTVEGALPTKHCNPEQIGELFYNLIVNGIKYNTAEQKKITIRCLREAYQGKKRHRNVIAIEDNGIGIAPEFHTDIFRIFKRLNSEKKFGAGTGAGLTFVKKIIEMHHGHIWLTSVPGEGTCFYFTLGGKNVQNA